MEATANDQTISSGQATATEEYDETKNVYVKNFDLEVTDEMLNDAFKGFGTITSCVVAKNEDGTSRGFGFVAYETTEEAQKAIKEMKGKLMWGSNLYVAQFQKKTDRVAMLAEQMASMKIDREPRLFIKNVHVNVTDMVLKEFLSKYGEVVKAEVQLHKTGISKGLALVTFKEFADAKAAVKASREDKMDELLGKKLIVSFDKGRR
uniref:RRM domain-containing protein n=1 Tax=Steinernema glaseri TaxID=37863 RepID=A0A1I7XYU7_9BILA